MAIFETFNLFEFIATTTESYLIFYLVLSVLSYDVSAVRLIVSGVLVALGNAIVPTLKEPTFTFNVIVRWLAILVMKREYTLFQLIRSLMIYVVVLVLSSGLKLLLIELLSPNEVLMKMVVCCSILALAFCFKLLRFIGVKREKRRLNCVVELIGNGIKLKAKGFWDSGNRLYFNSKPVVVLSKKVVKKMALTPSLEIPVQTVNGVRLLKGGKIDLKIYLDKKTHNLASVFYCVSDTILSEENEVILHRDMEVVC